MFRYITAGESHGRCLTAIIEGVPAGVVFDVDAINRDLSRRQKGYGRGARMEIETDSVSALSGVRNGRTIGAPITLQIINDDFKNWDNASVPRFTLPRPGHADLPGALKYETDDIRDILERASARETAIRVAVGAFAKTILRLFNIGVHSHVKEIAGAKSAYDPATAPSFEAFIETVESSPLRVGDRDAEEAMIEAITRVKAEGDTLGGIVEIIAQNVPAGLGSHVHWERKLDARIAYALMSVQGVKAVEIGEGVDAARRKGSQMHDEIFFSPEKRYYRMTNRAGGVEGGISNGEPLVARAAMKPIPTLMQPLRSVDIDTKEEAHAAKERSDVLAVPALGVVCEAVIAAEILSAFMERYGGDSIAQMTRRFKEEPV